MMPTTTSNSIRVKPRSLSSHGRCPRENDLSSVPDSIAEPARSEEAGWPADEGSDRTEIPPGVDDDGYFCAGITGALVGSRSARRTRTLDSGGDLVILLLSLGLGGAGTGDRPLRLGRLLPHGRLVVFPATGQPQEARSQQSRAAIRCVNAS